MDLRTTSAGYRLPLGKTTTPFRGVSEKPAPASGTSPAKRKDPVDRDEVSQNKIWRERVEGEWKGVEIWFGGFLKFTATEISFVTNLFEVEESNGDLPLIGRCDSLSHQFGGRGSTL